MLEHNFTGPSFTIGIEEELMLLDAETMELSQSIEACSRRCRPSSTDR